MTANRHQFRVYYGDTDMAGIVYYANYLRWFEAGRSELIRSLGISYKSLSDEGKTAPVTSASVRYLAPARYEDDLELETKVEEIRQVSFRITYRLTRVADGVLISTGETTHACVDASGKLTRLPPTFRAALSGQP